MVDMGTKTVVRKIGEQRSDIDESISHSALESLRNDIATINDKFSQSFDALQGKIDEHFASQDTANRNRRPESPTTKVGRQAGFASIRKQPPIIRNAAPMESMEKANTRP